MDSTDQFQPGIHDRVSLYAKQLADEHGLLLPWETVEEGLEDVLRNLTEHADPETDLAHSILGLPFINDDAVTAYLSKVKEAREKTSRPDWWDMDGDVAYRERWNKAYKRHKPAIERIKEAEAFARSLRMDQGRMEGLKVLITEVFEGYDDQTQSQVISALVNDRREDEIVREAMRKELIPQDHPVYVQLREELSTYAHAHGATKEEEVHVLNLLRPRTF